MSNSKIEELKKSRQQREKNKNSQVKYGWLVLLVCLVIFIYFALTNRTFSLLWMVGLLIGFTLQRSRFCFVASFRDPIMIGSTSLFKAIIIAFIISTIGFGIIQPLHLNDATLSLDNIPSQIKPVGIHTIVGAVLFGIGMVIAGGCASGTLIRIGEGFLLQVVVLIGFIGGTLIGAKDFEFWDKMCISESPVVYFPKYLGLPLSMTIQIIILIVLYKLADWYDKKNSIMSV
ncbi:YeeE/YedE thiosulfate transporter family protein [Serpentinicella alkaliphila]|uniref:Uncharacterized protein n=1 Tax=Serpentinicella alkaliphila TaxID=1734049 RepID=A0A4R2TJM3_9FIRM|nr:YeeE/YedE thiosulfate transporter family protein [Serpentinicella alkaliphila]QUH24600.1 YeeE/YedE family protein [Serpentinicella alkaliphila]TCQ02597.1 hypothetical protein EDD79_101411 [Serpentinicella alkaliphila]